MKEKTILAVGLLAFSFAGYGDVRSLSVDKVRRDGAGRIVDVDLVVSTGEEAVLYVAWGTVDGGDVRDSWDVYRPVARLAGATTSYTYAFPKGIADDVRSARFFLLDGYDVSLDKQYDSIRTDGSQYVWTQFAPSGLSAIEMEMSLQSVDSSVALFCARKDKNNNDSMTAFYIAKSGWRFDYFGTKSAFPPVAEANERYVLRTDPTGVSLNNEKISTLTSVSKAPGNPLLLFGACYGREDSPQYCPSLTLYSFKAWPTAANSDVLALDLVPGEKGGVVGLFNKIDGSFLSSESVGHPFAAGAEVSVSRANVLSQTGTLEGRLGAERTIHIAAKRRDESTRRLASVDLAFTTGLDRMLYVVYGSADGGVGMSGWQHAKMVANVVGDVTSYTFDVPESWGDDVRFFGFRFCDAEYIPGCEARYEGVAVDGVYVATDFKPRSTSQIDMSLSFASVSDSQTIFCARRQYDNSLTVFYIANKGWRYDHRTEQYNTTVAAETGTRYALKMTNDGLYIDGVCVAEVPSVHQTDFQVSNALALFVASFGDPPHGTYPFKGTLYSFRALSSASDPDSAVLDLVPCKKNGNICLYNRVDGSVLEFGNLTGSGTVTPVGSCAVGTDVANTNTLSMDPGGLLLIFR